MNLNLKRSLLITLGLLLASVLLAPFGLGWLPVVVGVVLLACSLYVATRGSREMPDEADRDLDDSREDPQERRFAARMRGQRRGEDEAERRRQARERAQREADCGLTHDERVQFQSIVQNMNENPRQ